MTNATDAVPPVTNENITLVSKNYTAFVGSVHVGHWENVSITGNLNNGNLLILNVDPIKTEHHFKGLPIYGMVTSLTDLQKQIQINLTIMQQQPENQTQAGGSVQQNRSEGGQEPLGQLGDMSGNLFGQ